jgi:hypothetical protein
MFVLKINSRFQLVKLMTTKQMYCKLAIISWPISTHTVLNLFFSSFIIHYQDDLWDWELGTGNWGLGQDFRF